MEKENIKTEEQIREEKESRKIGFTVWIGTALISYAIGGRIGYKQGMKEGIAAGVVRGYSKCMSDVINKFR